jgi:hypothetical protein
MNNNALIALIVVGSLLFVAGCVMEPYGYDRRGYGQEDHGRGDYGYDGEGRHDYGRRVWRE